MKICIIFGRCMYLEQALGMNSVIDSNISKFFKCVLNLVDRENFCPFLAYIFYMTINHFT